MDTSHFTTKSQQALLTAREIAAQRNHQSVTPEHLLEGLLAQTDSIVYPVLAKLTVHVTALRAPLAAALDALPAVYGAMETEISPATLRVLETADAERAAMKDEYVSIEHLLVALAESASAAGDALRETGITKDAILKALTDVRGTSRVTSQDPESTFAPLE